MTDHNSTYTTSTGVHCIVEGCTIVDGKHVLGERLGLVIDHQPPVTVAAAEIVEPAKPLGRNRTRKPAAPRKPKPTPEPSDDKAEEGPVVEVDTADAATADDAADLVSVIRAMMQEAPREPMGNIGPSMLGGCERKIGYRLAFGETGERDDGSWIARVGTAVHAELDDMFRGRVEADGTRRWYTSLRVEKPVRGTIDLYDAARREVVDFKVVGATTLTKARRGEVDAKYDVQLDVYAVGVMARGYAVERVAILFLPKTQGLDKAVWYSRPVDVDRAVAAIERLRRVEAVISSALDDEATGSVGAVRLGVESLTTSEDFCRECPALAAKLCEGPPLKIERMPEWPAYDAALATMIGEAT